MTPLAKVVPHPHIEGAWTLDDPLAQPGGHLLLFASKASAETAAERRNKTRRKS